MDDQKTVTHTIGQMLPPSGRMEFIRRILAPRQPSFLRQMFPHSFYYRQPLLSRVMNALPSWVFRGKFSKVMQRLAVAGQLTRLLRNCIKAGAFFLDATDMKKLWTGLANLFGVKQNKKEFFTVSPSPRQHEAARRVKHSDFPSKAMRRGGQRALEMDQRPSRLAWIKESCRQALEVRKTFREKQLIKREIRAELKAV